LEDHSEAAAAWLFRKHCPECGIWIDYPLPLLNILGTPEHTEHALRDRLDDLLQQHSWILRTEDPSVLERHLLLFEVLHFFLLPDFVPICAWFGLDPSPAFDLPKNIRYSNICLPNDQLLNPAHDLTRRSHNFFRAILLDHPHSALLRTAILGLAHSRAPATSLVDLGAEAEGFWKQLLSDHVDSLPGGCQYLRTTATALAIRFECERRACKINQRTPAIFLMILPYGLDDARNLARLLGERLDHLKLRRPCPLCLAQQPMSITPAPALHPPVKQKDESTQGELFKELGQRVGAVLSNPIAEPATPDLLPGVGQLWLYLAQGDKPQARGSQERQSAESLVRSVGLRAFIPDAVRRQMLEDGFVKPRKLSRAQVNMYLDVLGGTDHPRRGILPNTVLTGAAQVVPFAVIDPRVRAYGRSEEKTFEEAESSLCTSWHVDYLTAPVIVKDRIWGILQFFWRSPSANRAPSGENAAQQAMEYFKSATSILWLTYHLRTRLRAAESVAFIGRTALALYRHFEKKFPELPETHRLTSDTVAAWLSEVLEAADESVFPEIVVAAENRPRSEPETWVEIVVTQEDSECGKPAVKIWLGANLASVPEAWVADYRRTLKSLEGPIQFVFADAVRKHQERTVALIRHHYLVDIGMAAVNFQNAMAEHGETIQTISEDAYQAFQGVAWSIAQAVGTVRGVVWLAGPSEETCDLVAVVNVLVARHGSFFHQAAAAGIEIVVHAPMPARVPGSANAWQVALTTLLVNAIEHTQLVQRDGQAIGPLSIRITADAGGRIESLDVANSTHPIAEDRVAQINEVLGGQRSAVPRDPKKGRGSHGIGLAAVGSLLRIVGLTGQFIYKAGVARVVVTSGRE
jgi:hypothetical protein